MRNKKLKEEIESPNSDERTVKEIKIKGWYFS